MATPNYGFPSAIEMKAGTYASPDINAGESWFSSGASQGGFPSANTYWVDRTTTSTPYNACLKAFTVKIADKGIALSSVNFPDANFLAELKQFDTDNDGYLSTAEIAAVTAINVSGKNISSLAGIEYFTALQTLNCSNNSISELDLSSNTALTSVDCSNNQLTYLILGKNSNLDSLNCSNNNLGPVDISGCPQLYNNSNYQHDDFDEAVPELKFNSVLLSGEIGLSFYMSLPKISDVDYSSSSMAFYIRNKQVGETHNYASSTKKVSGDQTYYIFTCYVNSAQMAEDITAHFAYGAGKSVEFVKSIHTYLTSAVTNAVSLNFSEKTIALMNAIRDYGHYAQLMLSEVRGWKIPDDYAEMPGTGTAYTTDDISAVNTDVTANYALTLTSQQAAGIQSMNYSLTFDTDTAINLYLTLTDDFKAGLKSGTKTLTVMVDGAAKNAEEQENGEHKGSYLVKISGIYAHKLGTSHTIEITADGTTSMQIYALSYVKTILNMNTATDAMKNAVTALYNYYKATVEYAEEQKGGNQ